MARFWLVPEMVTPSSSTLLRIPSPIGSEIATLGPAATGALAAMGAVKAPKDAKEAFLS